MKLWILSDWHMETRLAFEPPRPDFDVMVCAGDVEERITRAIRMVAALAGGKPAVFVAGNHDWRGPETIEEKLDAAHEAAHKYGVHFLEYDSCAIDGVRFAGATLWTPDDPRFLPSAAALSKAGADVVVTHFAPAPELLIKALPAGGLWIYGHHHGHSLRRIGKWKGRIYRGLAGARSFVMWMRLWRRLRWTDRMWLLWAWDSMPPEIEQPVWSMVGHSMRSAWVRAAAVAELGQIDGVDYREPRR